MKHAYAALAVALTAAVSILHADPINLWPEGKIPNVQANQPVPWLEWHEPANKTTDAVLIIAPGGAYNGWCGDHEGKMIVSFFEKKGLTTVLLRYRTPRPAKPLPKHLTAWQDAQRCVRLVRRDAAKHGVNPDKIGFVGFSAGGHLTLMTATSSTVPAYDPVDELDKTVPCNVNWAIPVYPAYVLKDGVDGGNTHGGNDLEKDTLVSDFAFDAKTPPLCFIHGDADVYCSMGSVRVYHLLRTRKIPAELHIYAKTPHGFGGNMPEWMETAWIWLKRIGQR